MPEYDKRQHEDLYTELMQGASKEGKFVIETDEEKPDMEFTVKPADKATRNKLRRMMPDGILNGVELPDNIEEMDPEDIDFSDMDLSEISISDMAFEEEATEAWLDEIEEHFSHEYYSPSEIRDIFGALQDQYFIGAGSYLIKLGTQTGPVKGFRKE